MTDWLVKVTFQDGESRYIASARNRMQRGDFTKFRGNAAHYESEDAALHVGYTYRDDQWNRVVDFEVEELD